MPVTQVGGAVAHVPPQVLSVKVPVEDTAQPVLPQPYFVVVVPHELLGTQLAPVPAVAEQAPELLQVKLLQSCPL